MPIFMLAKVYIHVILVYITEIFEYAMIWLDTTAIACRKNVIWKDWLDLIYILWLVGI